MPDQTECIRKPDLAHQAEGCPVDEPALLLAVLYGDGGPVDQADDGQLRADGEAEDPRHQDGRGGHHEVSQQHRSRPISSLFPDRVYSACLLYSDSRGHKSARMLSPAQLYEEKQGL